MAERHGYYSSHFWFGTGFGTSDTDQDPTENLGKFASTSLASLEHGSSYLAIISWVGMLGVLPFIFLLASIFKRIVADLDLDRENGKSQPPCCSSCHRVTGRIDSCWF